MRNSITSAFLPPKHKITKAHKKTFVKFGAFVLLWQNISIRMSSICYSLQIILILFSGSLFAQSNEALLDSANTAYSKNKFDAAIKHYDQIIANGYESPEVYYNLGNAHYKSSRIALAILNYERAKKLSPADEDINYNLKMANAKLVDKIESLPQLFITDWWNSFILSLSERNWSIIFIAFIWIGFAGLLIYFLTKNRSTKQLGFIICVAAFAFSLFFLFVARKSNQISMSRNEAIILTSSVSIKGSPSEQGTNLFILHEGTKVHLEQTNGDWLEVKIPNGNRGWIKSADLVII